MTEATSKSVLDQVPDEMKAKLREYHCSNCGRFLALQAIVEGSIVIRCRRCKELNVLDVQSFEPIDTPPAT